MKSILGALIGALSLTPILASAEEPKFEPAAYPFLPELVVNEDQQVCGPFEYAVIEAFKRFDFDITINDQDWPEADAKWLQFATIPDNTSQFPKIQFGEIDIDHDGTAEVLALVSWEFNWLDTKYVLALYPDREAFARAVANAKTDGMADSTSRESLALKVLAGRTNVGSRLGPSGSGDAADAQGGTWIERKIIEVNGGFFVVDRGEVYDDDTAISLWRIQEHGHSKLVCKVRTFTDDRGYSGGPLAPAPYRDLDRVLYAVAGSEASCGGTMHAASRVATDAGRVAARLSVRPWAALTTKPYNDRNNVDYWLDLWGHASVGNYRLFRQLSPVEATAEQALGRYYRDSFGLEPGPAAHWASVAVDILVRKHFKFPSSYKPDRQERRFNLERVLLEGASATEIEAMLVRGAQIADTALERDFDYGSEPTLFYALERPDLLNVLFAHGANVNVRNSFGKSALMYAAQFNLIESAEILLAHGAESNATTTTAGGCDLSVQIGNRTPLMYAAENAGYSMIALLIEAGGDVEALDGNGRSVGNYLERNTSISPADRRRIIELLRKPHP